MKVSMKNLVYFLLYAATVTILPSVFAQQQEAPKGHSASLVASDTTQEDSVKQRRERESVEMAKRVGQLENIIVYNAEMFRRELNAKMVWIYVLLGVMLVASLMMYGVISQVSRRELSEQEKHDSLLKELLTSGRNLEGQLKNLEAELKNLKTPARKASKSRKKTK